MGLLQNLSWPTAAFLAFAVLALYQIGRRLDEERRLRRTGGVRAARYLCLWPWGLDQVVRTLQAAAQKKDREMWERIFRKSGGNTAEFRVVGERFIFTQDPENIKALLATQFSDYGKGEPFHRDWHEFLGDSIFATDGPRWHASRQLIRPQFVKDRVSDLHTFETHLQTFFAAMSVGGSAAATAAVLSSGVGNNNNNGNGRVFDIGDLFFRYTLDVATDFLLGKDIQSLTIPRQEFAEAFTEVQRVQMLISRTGPVNRFVPRGSYRRGLRVIDEFVNLFIERSLRLPPEELEKSSTSATHYTFLHELARFTRDRKVLRDQIVAVLLAGRDTTAATLSWAIYELARHPECVQRLRAEIAQVVGVEGGEELEKGASSCRPPTYADLKAMRYLQHVLNETLRMYPAVPYNLRIALHDTTLPRGGGLDGLQPVAVLRDTVVAYSTLMMQRRPDLYPPISVTSADGSTTTMTLPDPDTFYPERWDHWQPKPWHYIPFNGGPRICIGQQFALTEMGYVLVRLFQRFDRVVSHMQPIDGGNPTLRSDIVLQPADGVHVAFFQPGQASR